MNPPNEGRISAEELATLQKTLEPLLGTTLNVLSIPEKSLLAFEPSQIGTICGALMDACIPFLDEMPKVGLKRHAGSLGEREGYPDYIHDSGYRMELKLLYMDNPMLAMKRPPTKREPSARLTQKVTVKNVDPKRDAMLLVAYRLQSQADNPRFVSPTIVDLAVLSMIELVEARDRRLAESGGRWFGNYETPTILSRVGKQKLRSGAALDTSSYGRKESEGKDYNEDTNFGKLKRTPHPELQKFLKRCGQATDEDSNDAQELPLDE